MVGAIMAGKYFVAPPGPCQLSGPDGGQCEHWNKCKALQIACKFFLRFVSYDSGQKWRDLERGPDRENYLAIFKQDEQKRAA